MLSTYLYTINERITLCTILYAVEETPRLWRYLIFNLLWQISLCVYSKMLLWRYIVGSKGHEIVVSYRAQPTFFITCTPFLYLHLIFIHAVFPNYSTIQDGDILYISPKHYYWPLVWYIPFCQKKNYRYVQNLVVNEKWCTLNDKWGPLGLLLILLSVISEFFELGTEANRGWLTIWTLVLADRWMMAFTITFYVLWFYLSKGRKVPSYRWRPWRPSVIRNTQHLFISPQKLNLTGLAHSTVVSPLTMGDL